MKFGLLNWVGLPTSTNIIFEIFLFNGQSIGKYFKSTLMKPKSLYRKANISVGIKFPRPRNIVLLTLTPHFISTKMENVSSKIYNSLPSIWKIYFWKRAK